MGQAHSASLLDSPPEPPLLPGDQLPRIARVEPTRGFEPRTYRLQDSPSTSTMALPATLLSTVIILVATAAPVDTSSRHTWCHAGHTGAVIFS
jgi:hypothetical protein